MKRILAPLITVLLLFLAVFNTSFAQSDPVNIQIEASVIEILQDGDLKLLGKTGDFQGKEILIDSEGEHQANDLDIHVGTQVVVQVTEGAEGVQNYYVLDVVRRGPLFLLFGIFVLVAVLVARGKGIRSLFAMALSFGVLFIFLLPSILAGYSPLLMTLIACAIIIPLSFGISHGFNKKTGAAVLGTLVALLITGVLALIFVDYAMLTGFVSEEVTFLQLYFGEGIQAKGLLLSGMIISLLGILDDVTISQAAIIAKLKQAAPKLTFKELYMKGLDVGKDHIGSVINTLVLVYTGASLPLLLLFLTGDTTFLSIINSEIVAEEVVRILIGSIGLILAVPMTNVVAAYVYNKKSS